MVKTQYYTDPEDSSWTKVTYKVPPRFESAEQYKDHKKRKALIQRREKMMAWDDPLYTYRKEQEDYLVSTVRRMRRNPQICGKLDLPTFTGPLDKVEEYTEFNDKDEEVTLTRKVRLARYCPGCYMNVPLRFFRGGVVCNYCMSLPIPKFEKMNSEPVIIDRRKRDENGNLTGRHRFNFSGRQTQRKSGTTNTAHRGQKSDAQLRRVERQAEEGVFERRVFSKVFIDKVVKRRLEMKMSQKELAMKINRTEKDIKDFEKGDMEFDPAVKSQLVWKLELNSAPETSQQK